MLLGYFSQATRMSVMLGQLSLARPPRHGLLHHTVCGVSYTAPENVIKDTFEATPAGDIWSFGTVLAEACVGGKLFTGKNRDEVRAEMLSIFGEEKSLGHLDLRDGCATEATSKRISGKRRDVQSKWRTNFQELNHFCIDRPFEELLARCWEGTPARRLAAAEILQESFFARPRFVVASGAREADAARGTVTMVEADMDR